MPAPTLNLNRTIGATCLAAGMLAWAPVSVSAAVSTEAGLKIMSDPNLGNCASCHVVPGAPGLQGRFGPSLEGVAQRLSQAQLRQWVTDARVLKPDTLMPPFGTIAGLNRPKPQQPVLNAEQIEQVVAALLSFR